MQLGRTLRLEPRCSVWIGSSMWSCEISKCVLSPEHGTPSVYSGPTIACLSEVFSTNWKLSILLAKGIAEALWLCVCRFSRTTAAIAIASAFPTAWYRKKFMARKFRVIVYPTDLHPSCCLRCTLDPRLMVYQFLGNVELQSRLHSSSTALCKLRPSLSDTYT